jgi:hypothetical protein
MPKHKPLPKNHPTVGVLKGLMRAAHHHEAQAKRCQDPELARQHLGWSKAIRVAVGLLKQHVPREEKSCSGSR